MTGPVPYSLLLRVHYSALVTYISLVSRPYIASILLVLIILFLPIVASNV